MKNLLVLIIFSACLIEGCTAYRGVSAGYVEYTDGWKVYNAREDTVLIKDDTKIRITPCNYNRKYYYMILPFPMYLGSGDKPKRDNFEIGISISNMNIPIFMDFSNISIFLKNGEQFYPKMYSKHYPCCDAKINEHAIIYETKWDEIANKISQTNTPPYFTYISLFFEISPPAIEDEFSIQLNKIDINNKDINIPVVKFKNGTAWGGW